MFMTLFSGLLPFATALLQFVLARSALTAEQKDGYMKMCQAIDTDAKNSADLRKSALSQRDQIFQQIDAENAAKEKADAKH